MFFSAQKKFGLRHRRDPAARLGPQLTPMQGKLACATVS
jgi:hypothetical protein